MTSDEIVRIARTLPEQERPTFVREACTGNAEQLRAVVAELDPQPDARKWWDLSFDTPEAGADVAASALVGTTIGSYRIVEVLGSGGMGTVVLAERADHAFDQRVAIKLLKTGLVSAAMQSRLKLERQILASLNHPHIAKLFDGGTTTNGTPYIVMEYIDGQPIDTFCDERRLTIRQRLELFVTVCSAVQYAHQNLIVHRDLKPSNILVATDGAPKLLDFGIAKFLDTRYLQHTIAMTQADVRLMTPDHASPEQLRGDLVATASDIYVLGVLLYELLTGRKPIATTSNLLSDLERAICELPPLPLSYGLTGGHVRLESSFLEALCAERSTSPLKLRRELSGDLNSIVLTALRKEPERRYSSVEQFAADINRYLTDKPVLARRDTWSYRARKFVGRYRYGVAASSVALVALVAFTLFTIEQNRRIDRERVRAEQIAGFLIELFQQADPSSSRGNEITVREILDIGARRMQSGLDAQPDTRASLLATMGSVYGSLGLYPDAIRLLEDSLRQRLTLFGSESLETADSMQQLGRALTSSGDYRRAEKLLEDSLHLQMKHAGENTLRIATALHDLSNLRQLQERFVEADQGYRRVLAMLDETEQAHGALLVEALTSRGRLQAYLGQQDDAIASLQHASELSKRVLGNNHPDTAHVIQNLADSLARQGRLVEAAPLFRQSLSLYRTLLGNEHPYTMMALANYGRFLQQSGQLDESEAILRETLDLNTKVRGPEHVFVGYSHMLLGLTLLEHSQCQQAIAEQEAALSIFRRSLPDEHLYVGSARLGLGRAFAECGRAKEAEVEVRTALNTFKSASGVETSMIGIIEGCLGRTLAKQGRYSSAEPLLKQGYVVALESRGEKDTTTKRMRGWIEDLYSEWGKSAAGKEFFATVDRPK